MSDLSIAEICERLQSLPEAIAVQEQVVIKATETLRFSELELDREYAKTFCEAKARDLKDAEAKQEATKIVIDKGWRAARDYNEFRLMTEQVILRKLQNEFVSIRKIASMKNDELRMGGHNF